MKIENIVGRWINHKTHGKGKILEFDGRKIFVKFIQILTMKDILRFVLRMYTIQMKILVMEMMRMRIEIRHLGEVDTGIV